MGVGYKPVDDKKKMCERFPQSQCIDCLPRPCNEEDKLEDLKSNLEMSRQNLMAYKEMCEKDAMKEEVSVQPDFEEFRSAVEVRFVIKDFFVDVSREQQNAIIELLKVKGIGCEYIDYMQGDADISKVIKETYTTVKPVLIAEQMLELCKEAKNTVLRFGEPINMNCKVNMIDGTRMHRDSSMPKVGN